MVTLRRKDWTREEGRLTVAAFGSWVRAQLVVLPSLWHEREHVGLRPQDNGVPSHGWRQRQPVVLLVPSTCQEAPWQTISPSAVAKIASASTSTNSDLNG